MAGTAAAGAVVGGGGVVRRHQRRAGARPGRCVRALSRLLLLSVAGKGQSYTRSGGNGGASPPSPNTQIGRASCRGRGCQYVSISVVAVSLNKKQTTKSYKARIYR